jgi:hypothetical protein
LAPPKPSDSRKPVGDPYTDKAVDPKTQQTVTFECTNYEHDVTKNYDQILWLGGVTSAVKPGIVLQGDAFKKGSLQPVPLRRSGATVSIDLGIETPTRAVAEASTATLQEAVSGLQAEADRLPDLPSTLTFNSEEVESSEQLAYSLGVHASYDGLVARAGFEGSFSRETGLTQHTITAKLVQPMYTISFADDQLATPADFFAQDLSDADWKKQAELGTISSTNTPVFISSVTYGRMLMFTVESTQGESATDLSAAVRVSAKSFDGGGNFDLSAKETLKRSKIQVLAIGGSNQAAAAALTGGDLSQFFTKTNATGAVPISFVVRTVHGTREIALLGDVTKFKAPTCKLAQTKGAGWVQVKTPDGKVFTSISVSRAGMVRAVSNDGIYGYNADDSFNLWWGIGNVKQVAIGVDGTMGYIDNDTTVYFAQPNKEFEQVSGAGRCIDVYDVNHSAVCGGNSKLYVGDTSGNWDWSKGGGINKLALDVNGKVWATSVEYGIYSWTSNTGWQRIDEAHMSGVVDYVAVGAPEDVYIVSNGSNYKYDPSSGIFNKLSYDRPMVQIDVGVDGTLFGIGPDGFIYRYVSAN